MMWLTSCVTIKMPPTEYLKDCPVTYLKDGPAQNKDLAKTLLSAQYEQRKCNVDKAALRAWYEGYRAACGVRCKLRED